ncbi:MAG: FAD-dependent oxidoreductase [Vampirovibrionales bacterium]|nr:FAD-dependent oxidoreductase [Vampirovibrionales bacterium]
MHARLNPPPKTPYRADVLVFGDELESCLAAVSAAKNGARVILARRGPRTQWLGGLSTLGGLAYMDLSPGYLSPLFARFLKKARVKRVALDPNRAHRVLQAMLRQAGVKVLHNLQYPVVQAQPENQTAYYLLDSRTQQPIAMFNTLIDATPDADLARQMGANTWIGMDGQFGPEANFLGVSPVFTLHGVTVQALVTAEKKLRARADMGALLRAAFPANPKAEVDAWVSRDPIIGPDYIDILNPAIGVLWHIWQTQQLQPTLSPLAAAATYPAATTWIDGANIAILNNRLSWNGLVWRCSQLETLLGLSRNTQPMPDELQAAMQSFEAFLREQAGLPQARIKAPRALYVRQTVNIQTRSPMTLEALLMNHSGDFLETPAGETPIGTYSYWIDTRGLNLWQNAPALLPLPKPVFKTHLGCCLMQEPHLANLAVLSRAAGFYGLAQGACRIVQHLCLLAEALGIAAALATRQQGAIAQVSSEQVAQHMQRAAQNAPAVYRVSPWLS